MDLVWAQRPSLLLTFHWLGHMVTPTCREAEKCNLVLCPRRRTSLKNNLPVSATTSILEVGRLESREIKLLV